MKIGDVRSYKRIITKEDVKKFGELTGDMNDTHFNEAYAQTTIFKKPIVHGMLIGSLFSKIFGLDYPGEGTIYCSQSLVFKKPVYPEQMLHVVVTVKDIVLEKNRVIFQTEILNEQQEVMLTGEAMLMPRKEVSHE
jgi:acyl dehydratase